MIGLAPIEALGALGQAAMLGGWCGTLWALWLRRSEAEADVFRLVALGTLCGVAAGVGILLIEQVR